MSTCPHPDCDAEVSSSTFACRPHWFSLPPGLRNRIWANFRSGDVDRILSGYDEAAQFWGAP